MFRRTTLQSPREAAIFLERIEQMQPADFYIDFGRSLVTVFSLALIENGLPVDAENLFHAIETKGASLPVRTYRAELQEELNRIHAHDGEHFSMLMVSTLSAICKDYGFNVGDTVCHVKGCDTGIVAEIDAAHDLAE